MISAEFEFVKAKRLLASRPLVFSRNIFCPDVDPGLKFPVNGFSVHTSFLAGGGGITAATPPAATASAIVVS